MTEKNFSRRKLLFEYLPMFAAGILLPSSANSKNDNTINVAVDEWFPYEFSNEDGKISGYTVEVLEVILDEIDYAPIYHVVPWTRGLHELKKN